jgi:kynureninase
VLQLPPSAALRHSLPLRHSCSHHRDADPSQRGCQLSLRFTAGCAAIAELLERESVVVDIRKPDVMRVSPAPLYNSFSDVADFVRVLRDVLAEVRTK